MVFDESRTNFSTLFLKIGNALKSVSSLILKLKNLNKRKFTKTDDWFVDGNELFFKLIQKLKHRMFINY